MDPDIEIIEKDSGMSSIGDSKDDTPERKVQRGDDNNVGIERKDENHALTHCY